MNMRPTLATDPAARDRSAAILALLDRWIEARLDAPARIWYEAQRRAIPAANDGKALSMALGLAARKLGKADLALSRADLAEANRVRPGFVPGDWSLDQAARVAFVLSTYAGDDAAFAARVEQLCATAEIGELVGLLRGFAVFPAAPLLLPRAREAIRSAMRPVFEAIAHRNPYPREQFDENAWNQMVLKTLFIGSTLKPVQGLDERANTDLAIMLDDYAHERWAAGRAVSPELWRCVGPYATPRMIDDLTRVLTTGTATERRAAALALAAARTPSAIGALDSTPVLAIAIANGSLTWDTLDGETTS
jgi:hypothetical protein